MATSTQVILTRATILLQDPTFVRWPLGELFDYISDGQKEICLFKPNAYVVLGNILLATGTKQSLNTPVGTAVGATTNAAGYSAGVSTVTLASAGTGSILPGDIIVFAGDNTRYTVTSGDPDVSNGGTISFTPILAVTMSAAAKAITIVSGQALSLIDVIRNRGAEGATEGNAIRVVGREILDAQNPGWHGMTGDSVVKHYIYNPKDPTHFYVYPPQAVTPHYIEVLYGAVPAGLPRPGTTTALSDFASVNIDLPDIYMTPLINYVMYRAYSKDAEYAANGALAQKYFELFMAAVTGKTTVEMALDPNASSAPGNPNTLVRK